MFATKASTVSTNDPHHRRSRSYSSRNYAHDRDFRCTSSDARHMVKYPDVEGIRKVHAEALNQSTEGRRRESDGQVASRTPRRAQSDSKTYMARRTEETAHEVGRRGDPEHRHRSHKLRREDSRPRGDTAHVSRTRSREETDGDRPPNLGRSKTAGEASIPRRERPHKEDKEPTRRQSERRSSLQEGAPHTPLRRERRSVAEGTDKRSREEPPVRRYNPHQQSAETRINCRGLSRSASIVESKTPSLLRPFLKRSQTSARNPPAPKNPTYVPSPRSPPLIREKGERAPSIRRTRAADRSSGIFSFIAAPKPAKQPEPEERVTCITCLSDDVRISRCPKLSCSHRMCHSCLRRIFNLSITDPQHMPPKCCTEDCIPLEYVIKLFDNNFKIKWNRKYQEYTTKNRIYCPAKRCGEWIKPSHIHTDTSGGANHGRKYGKCQRCQTKVCCLCNNKWHTTRQCPKDAATQEFIKIAKQEGWQSCYNCKATVEKIEGCNHMTCRCGAQFCLTCGTKWKGCACLWFDEQAYDANLAYGGGDFPQAHNYQQEIDRRHQQEFEDEAFAREMEFRHLHHDFDRWDDFGNAAPHFLNEDFRRRAADALSATFNPIEEIQQLRPQQPPPPPPPPVHAPRLQQEPRQRPLRQHSTASRQYNHDRQFDRPNERVVPRRIVSDYATEAERHRPVARGARASMLAGITRGQTGDGRVDEWRRHVGPLS